MGELNVEISAADSVSPPASVQEVEDAVLWLLRAEGVEDAEISVALVGDEEIASLNQAHLEHEGPTDVISFPLALPGGQVVGDIYIGVEQAARQARELGVPAREELLRLAMHGTLHVLGYDHPEDEARENSPMYGRQEEVLRAFLQRDPAR